MAQVQNLINAYKYDCFNPLIKTIITILREKTFVQLSVDFMNAKKYKAKNPSATDVSRFNDLMVALVNAIKDTTKITPFITTDEFYDDLTLFFKLQYDVLREPFTNGSYTKIIDALNRIFNPKKSGNDDDEKEENENEIMLNNLRKYVKTYLPTIDNILNDFKLYHYTYEFNDDIDIDDFYTQEIINMYKNNYVVFNLYHNNHALWCFQSDSKELDTSNYKFASLTIEEFMKYIKTDDYTMNSSHYTTIDTIKRDYIGKAFDTLKTHLQMIPNLYLYQGNYKNNSDFDQLNDIQMRNTIMGFPNGFDDDITKKCLAIFCFNGQHNVILTSFWLTTQPIVNILNKTDYDAFEWSVIDTETYLSSISQDATIGTSCLH